MSVPHIEVASSAGVCYGVERALKMASQAARFQKHAHTLGPLIHNPRVVAELAAQGVTSVDTPAEAETGALVIRAHGVAPTCVEEARSHGLEIVDATCPHVKKVHHVVQELSSQGYFVVVVGERDHAEVQGILAHASERSCAISSATEARVFDCPPLVGVVSQTTQTPKIFSEVVAALSMKASELRVYNTICNATHERQDSACELAGRADVMLIIGGRNSGNTRRLVEVCCAVCPRTHHIEAASELVPSWFDGAQLIGISAGASTPDAHIEEVVASLHTLFQRADVGDKEIHL